MPDFDLAVIGAGAAGLSVTAAAAQLGLRVALIERDRMGGDCLNAGCVPSKALLAASHAAAAAGRAGRFGIRLPEPQIDWDAVAAHVHGAIAAIAPMDSVARYRALGATVMQGEARFLDPGALSVDGKRLTARRVVIAAGSRPAMPPIPGLQSAAPLTNETIFAQMSRPSHLLVLGGGPLGLEMAAAHAALGCRVTLVEQASIAGTEDPELVDALRRALGRQGVAIREGTRVVAAEAGPTLVLADGERIGGSHLLVAAGRRPNLEALALDAGNVRAGPHGIATDGGLRSLTNRRVYAAGDIADPAGLGPRAFTHVGAYHATIIVRRAIFRLPARLDYAALPRVIHAAPELAQAGMTEAEACDAGMKPRVLRWPMAENDRAIVEQDTAGMVKLVVARGRVVGAGILAPHAGEMIGLWALAIAARVRLSVLAGLVLPYPTRAEAGKRAAGSLYAAALFCPARARFGAAACTVALKRRLNQPVRMDQETTIGSGGVTLAVQGGGAHGAFAWGVLDGLLEGGVRIDTIGGVSSGAILATMLVQGHVRGGAAGARAEMRRLWRRISQAHSLSPFQHGPLQRWLWGWDMSVNPLWQEVEAAMRLFSPAQFNPLGHNPLRHVLDELLDRRLLGYPGAPRLMVAATDVETGEAVLWSNEAITVDALLASSCLPFVFPAVEIGGRAYWDGGYAGNPPLRPMLEPKLPTDLVLIRAQPERRPGVPTTASEIIRSAERDRLPQRAEGRTGHAAGVRSADHLRRR